MKSVTRLLAGSSPSSSPLALAQALARPILSGAPLSALRWMATDVEYRDRAPVDLHFVSGKPDQTEPGLLYRGFPRAVGSSLNVTLPISAISNIDVNVGHLEEIAVQVTEASGMDLEPCFIFNNTEKGLELIPATGSPGLDNAHDVKVTAWIPERFCSVDVEAKGANVQVKSVIEAALRISSGGGDIILGTVRASDAFVETSGGALTGSITAYNVGVNTGGGDLSLKRLVGREVNVSTEGGNSQFKVVYGDRVDICSGGGRTSVNSVKVSELCSIDSCGGDVQLDGADGCTRIFSKGGRVKVQMLAEARLMDISSAGGEIAVALPAGCRFALDASAGGGVTLDPQVAINGKEGPCSVVGKAVVSAPGGGRKAMAADGAEIEGMTWREAGLSELQARADDGSGDAVQAELGKITASAGASGRMSLKVQSWMDAIARKYGAMAPR